MGDETEAKEGPVTAASQLIHLDAIAARRAGAIGAGGLRPSGMDPEALQTSEFEKLEVARQALDLHVRLALYKHPRCQKLRAELKQTVIDLLSEV